MSYHLYTPASTTVTISELNSQKSLAELFQAIEALPFAMLLDTAGTSNFGRYSIAVWSPDLTITSSAGKTHVTCQASRDKTQVDQQPLAVVDTIQRAYFNNLSIQSSLGDAVIEALPFLIGCMGLAGYDLGRYYENLPSEAINHYACPDMAVGVYPQSIIEDTQTGTLYYCRLSHLPEVPQFMHTASREKPFSLTTPWQSNLSRSSYVDSLHRIHEYLLCGDCYQVNMAQRFSAGYSGSEWEAYKTLRHTNKAPFSAFIRLPEATLLSISPERFLSVKNGKVETKPIKGTRPRFEDAEADKASADDLLAAEKDRAENLMIVDLLRNDLSKHCKPGTVDVPSLFALESYEAVHHMVSTVVGELDDRASPLDLLAGAFPGGSITGAPKIRAMEIIDELEPHRRNIYCGSVFYLGFRQDMDSSILIRSLLAENGQMHCWAGGGIVIDSKPEDEYQETLDKVSRILPVLEQQIES